MIDPASRMRNRRMLQMHQASLELSLLAGLKSLSENQLRDVKSVAPVEVNLHKRFSTVYEAMRKSHSISRCVYEAQALLKADRMRKVPWSA